MAVADLGLAPSEVRAMSLAEIYAVMWAKTRDVEEQKRKDGMADLYDDFKAMQERKRLESEDKPDGI